MQVRSKFKRTAAVVSLVAASLFALPQVAPPPVAQAASVDGTAVHLPSWRDGYETLGSMIYNRGEGRPAVLTKATVNGKEVYTYCVEMSGFSDNSKNPDVRRNAEDGTLASWSNLKAADPQSHGTRLKQNLSQIAAVAETGYPSASLSDLASKSGYPGLTAKQAVTGTQAAIWHFSDFGGKDGVQAWDFGNHGLRNSAREVLGHRIGVGTTNVDPSFPSSSGKISNPGSEDKESNDYLGAKAVYDYLIKAAAKGTTEVKFLGYGYTLTGTFVQSKMQDRVVIEKNPPKPHAEVTTTADEKAEVGKEFHDVANVKGDIPEESKLTFKLYKQNGQKADCNGKPVAETKPVDVPKGKHDTAIKVESPNVTVNEPGTYYWVETLTDANGKVLAQGDCGAKGETTTVTTPPTPTPTPTPSPSESKPASPTPTPTKPVVPPVTPSAPTPSESTPAQPNVKVTTVAQESAEVGTPFKNTAKVTGDVPEGAQISFQLFKQNGEKADCTTPTTTTAAVPVSSGTYDGMEVTSPEVTVNQAGTYYWVETLTDKSGKVLAKGECGAKGETTTVTPKPTPTPTPTPSESTPASPTPTPTKPVVPPVTPSTPAPSESTPASPTPSQPASPSVPPCGPSETPSVPGQPDKPGKPCTPTASIPSQPAKPTPSEPVPRKPKVHVTTIATSKVEAGKPAHDTAVINGEVPQGAKLSFELFEKKGDKAECSKSTRVLVTPSQAVKAGKVTNLKVNSPGVVINKPGTYYWVETLTDQDGNVLSKGECNAPHESTQVVPPKSGSATPTPNKPGVPPVVVVHTPEVPAPGHPGVPKLPETGV